MLTAVVYFITILTINRCVFKIVFNLIYIYILQYHTTAVFKIAFTLIKYMSAWFFEWYYKTCSVCCQCLLPVLCVLMICENCC